MQLKEIRNLLVLFLKQFNKDDVSLLLNYLPIFLEDIQRDPLLLEKLSSSTAICFNTVINKTNTEFVSNYEPAKEDANNFTDHWVTELTNSKTNETTYDDDLHSEETNHSHFTDTNQLIPSRYSDSVVEYLSKKYTLNKYPKSDQLYQMALEINLTAKQIQTWFSNTRFKLKHSKLQLASKSNSPAEQQSPDDPNEYKKNDQNELVPEETIEPLEMDSNIIDNNSNDNTTVSNTTEVYEHEIESDEYIDLLILNRTRLPGQALDYLITKYKKNKYPNSEEIYQMSLEINLTTKKIKNWFDSTRYKLKHAKKSLNTKHKKVNLIIENYDNSFKEQIEAETNNDKDLS